MIDHSFYFHNGVEFSPSSGGGHYVRRFPARLREALSPLGRMVSADSAGCEIRFVTDAESIRIDLAAQSIGIHPHELHNLDVTVFRGPFIHSHWRLQPGRINHLHLTDIGGGDGIAFAALRPAVRDTPYFHQNVWRILLGRYAAILHAVDTYGYPVRPPHAHEQPRLKMLCYGSSITNGASPSVHHLSYIYQAARQLGIDVFNQGLSGSCRLEKEVADYLADRTDWDFITLELGVNVRREYSKAQFAERVRCLLGRLAHAHPDKPAVLITIFPNAHSPEIALVSCDVQQRQVEFDDVLRLAAAEQWHPHLHVFDGSNILADPGGLTRDLIHPGDYGHTEMGHRLAALIRKHISLAEPFNTPPYEVETR